MSRSGVAARVLVLSALVAWLCVLGSVSRAAAATTATFGNTSIGTATSTPATGYKFGSVYSLNQAGTTVSFSWYTKGGAAPQQMQPVIYAATGSGPPTTLITTGTAVTIAANQPAGWVTSSLPSVSLASGSFLLGLMSGASGSEVTNYLNPVSDGAFWNPNTFGSPTSTWGVINHENSDYSFYVTYTPGSAGSGPVNGGLPVVSGTAQVGLTLSVSTGVWTNSPTAYSYQWQRCSGGSCSNIVGATNNSYQPVGADVGDTLDALVTAANSGGSGTAGSQTTAVVTQASTTAATLGVTTVGTSSSVPASGYKFGSVFPLSSAGVVSDFRFYARGGGASQSFVPVIYSVDSSGNPADLVAQGATVTVAANQAAGWVTSTLPADVDVSAGSYLLGLLSGSAGSSAYNYYSTVAGRGIYNSNGSSTTPTATWGAIDRESAQWSFYIDYTPSAGAVGSAAPTDQSVPTISGVATVGQTLTANTGSWTNSPTSYAYQWLACSNSCTPISGATQGTYFITSGDVGERIVVSVAAHNSAGANTASSAATAAVSNVQPTLNIGWLGDSIMAGGNACNEHTVNDAVSDLQSDGYTVTSDNRALAGYGSDDWAAGTSSLGNAESSFSAAGVKLVVIMLGTNDVRTPAEYKNNVAALTPSQHYGNMRGIVNSLTGDGFGVVLDEPIYTVPGTSSNGVSWPANVNSVYGEYWSLDSGLANGTNVFIGDTSGIRVMGQSGNLCGDGIHPSVAGAAILGRLWATGIENRAS